MIQDNYRFIPFPCDSCSDNCVLTGSKSNICDKLVQYNVAVLERQLENMNLESALNYFGDIINLNVKGVVHVPCIYAANHTSYLDPILIMLAMKDISGISIVVAEEVANKFTGFCNDIKCITINRDGNPLDIIHKIEVEMTDKCIIFPEGTRSRDGKLQKLKSGVGQIAIDKGCFIQPIYIKGAYEIWSPYDSIPQKGLSATVEFLEPIQPVTRKQVTKDLHDILKEKENEYSC